MSFLTFHLLTALPMHNLNRDQTGMPKSQFDGGVQRARLSSQALKRPARIAFREAVTSGGSYRTKHAAEITTQIATEWAQKEGREYDPVVGKKAIKAVIDSLVKSAKKAAAAEQTDAEAKDAKDAKDDEDAKDNILLFAHAELETLARAAVEAQHGGAAPTAADCILDFKSPALDVAAFGRMFADRSDLSTHAAVAVSHAVTTHPMALTVDYFTAVDDFEDETRTDSGAAHLGLTYYTSGVYYRTFTVDTDQMARSWSSIDAPTAPEEFALLIRAMLTSLPTGRLTNSNAHTRPYLILVEEQRSRVVYDFETPVQPERDGGYKRTSVAALAEQRALATTFDPANTVAALIQGETFSLDFQATEGTSLQDVVEFATERVFGK